MSGDTPGQPAIEPRDPGPRGRWDLWLLGIGVAVLLVIWIVDPFYEGPMPGHGPDDRPSGLARVNPPADWFKGERGNLFQQRIVATRQYDKGGVSFDLPEEKQRLKAWLQQNNHRDSLRRDPLAISTYHALDKDTGGRISKHLQWFPHKVEADPMDRSRYELAYSQSVGRFEKSQLDKYIVPLFTLSELGKGPTVMKRALVEYVPINMHERGFTLQDLDLTQCWAGFDQDGRPAFFYRIKPGSSAAYGNFSEEYIGFECAIIIGGYVNSAPYFLSRIPSNGMISMGTQADVQEFAREIRALLPGK